MPEQLTLDVNNSIVQKKWGQEYLFFRNENVAIWHLFIRSGEETSFHCHPKKSTGLIVVGGVAKVSFLNNLFTLKDLDKVQIFPRRFHKTQSLSLCGTTLLEVESPEDKFDLVRLADKYGRQGQQYEGSDCYKPLSEEQCRLKENTLTRVGNCWAAIQTISSKDDFKSSDFEDTYVCIRGGMGPSDEQLVVCPGDVVSVSNLKMLSEHFQIKKDSQFIKIWKN
jgi:mannose-6-phosphate isomerase-like protein (cupin superfamily)